MEILSTLSVIFGLITSAFTLSIMIIKPFRNWILGIKKEKQDKEKEETFKRDTDKCLLRDRILSLYYQNCEQQSLKIYEYENICYMYKQYKALGGNSFVEKIWNEIKNWRVIK